MPRPGQVGSDPSRAARSPLERGCACGEGPGCGPCRGRGHQAHGGHEPGPAAHSMFTPRTLPAAPCVPPWQRPGPAWPGATERRALPGPRGGAAWAAHPQGRGWGQRSGAGATQTSSLTSARPALSAELTPLTRAGTGQPSAGEGSHVPPGLQLDPPWAWAPQRDPHSLAMGWDQGGLWPLCLSWPRPKGP